MNSRFARATMILRRKSSSMAFMLSSIVPRMFNPHLPSVGSLPATPAANHIFDFSWATLDTAINVGNNASDCHQKDAPVAKRTISMSNVTMAARFRYVRILASIFGVVVVSLHSLT